MLGTNKTAVTQRLSNGAYSDYVSDVKCRYSPIKASSDKGYVTKASHVIYELRADQFDCVPGDRIVVECDKTFVAAGVRTFDDATGKHIAILVREIGSAMHEDVEHKTVSDTQTTYDPIFQEWSANDKDYDSATISVLLDPFEAAKESFLKIIEAGKLEDVDWIMTVDFPTSVKDEDKFVFNSVEYEVKWIIPHPFQTLVGLRKGIRNYKTN